MASVAALVLLVACGEQSRIDSDAGVAITGVVVASDGAPLEDRPARLGTGVSFTDGALGFLTVGLSCLGGGCSGEIVETTTATDGSFRFELLGSDTQSSFGEAVSTLVSVSAAPSDGEVTGAMVSARFRVQTDQVALPQLRLVDPGLTLDDGESVVARWSDVPPGPVELRFEQAEVVPVWAVSAIDGAVALDPRVLEGTTGRVVLAGSSEDRIEGSGLVVTWRSGGRPYASVLPSPASRGAACRTFGAEGRTGEPVMNGCELTDGDLTSAARVPGPCVVEAADDPSDSTPSTNCLQVAGYRVDLVEPVPADLIVVRGCGGCPVDVSSDGVTFRRVGDVGQAEDDFGALGLDGEPVASVRVHTFGSLREVSVWAPLADDEDVSIGADGAGDLRSAFLGTAGAGHPRWLVAVAVAAIAVSLIALGVVIGRRRPTAS